MAPRRFASKAPGVSKNRWGGQDQGKARPLRVQTADVFRE